jgi:phosphoribosylcarboxyaminoimidazole (NCAIR) mutase
VAVDGSANAGILAVEILAVTNVDLGEKLSVFRADGAR